MLTVNASAPRRLRSHLHRMLVPHTQIGAEPFTLYLLSPVQCGCKAWRFAVLYLNVMVLIGKPVASRDAGRRQALARYGVKSQEVRGESMPVPRAPKEPKAPKMSHRQRLDAALGAA